MREHRQEPGKSTSLTPTHHHDHHGNARAVGKSTLAQAASDQADPTASAASSDAEIDIGHQFEVAENAWNYVKNERQRALTELDDKIKQTEQEVSGGLLAKLGEVALNMATSRMGGMIAQEVAGQLGNLILERVFQKTQDETHVRVMKHNDQSHAFVEMQLHALNAVQEKTLNHLSAVKADMLKSLTRKNSRDKVREATAVRTAFRRRREEAYQLQYNISLGKWFAALSQSSFGTDPNHKRVSNIGRDKLPTDPIVNGSNNFGSRAYKGKEGFVHIGLLVGPKPIHVKVTHFATPGIDVDAWAHRDPARTGGKALGELALGDLPHDLHLPIIADVKFHFDPFDREVAKYFPGGTARNPFQPIALSWNERDVVVVDLPTKANSDYPITQEAREFLGRRLGHATNTRDANAAGRFLMREKIGKHSLGLLRGLSGGDRELP